jgi:hypothetical protein
MSLTFDGFTISGGITPLFGTTDNSQGRLGGTSCTITQESGIGISFDPFSIEIPCECTPQTGDTITATVVTILLLDITTIEWNLCGGECRGSETAPGFAIGAEVKRLKWAV